LALFERRPPEQVAPLVTPASKNLHRNRKYGIGPINPLGREKADLRRLKVEIATPRFGANLLLPFGWDSNPAELAHGGPTSWGTSPNGNLSMSAPIASNLRFTASGFGEANLHFSVSEGAPGVSYGQWDLRAALKLGWRF
jgi:hypothetical protein